MFLVGFSSFMRTIPYFMFGPGENIKMYTKEYGAIEDVFNSSMNAGNLLYILSVSLTGIFLSNMNRQPKVHFLQLGFFVS